MVYTVVMAGGLGTRFWPWSRESRPKQFLNVFGESSLLQNTVQRVEELIPPERAVVVTNERYVEKTQKQLPDLPAENILAEPTGRNTAPCIAWAAAHLYARDPEAVMVVLPADHLIRQVDEFHEVLETAIATAKGSEVLVTIGIEPAYPSSAYGYIQFDDDEEDAEEVFPVKAFAEKPDIATAERFVDSGDFLWNSGMFIWKAETILNQLAKHQPDIYELFAPLMSVADPDEEDDLVQEAYQQCTSISIDYGVMEQAEDVFVVPGSFEWSDVGDWRAVYELSEKDDMSNAIEGDAIVHDSSRNLVRGEDRLIVLVGTHDTVVVDTDDAVLVCNRESSQEVKRVVEYLRARNLDQYL